MTATYEIFDPAFAEMIDTTIPPEIIAAGFIWTEGPVWLSDCLYLQRHPEQTDDEMDRDLGCFGCAAQ